MTEFARESVEFQRVEVFADGELVRNGVELALHYAGDRPTNFAPAELVDNMTGMMIRGLAPGRYVMWYRIIDNPESPVKAVPGYITIT